MAWTLVQSHALDVVALDPRSEIGDIGQRHDHVSVRFGRHVVDQIDHAIFKPAGVEPMQHMHDQRQAIVTHDRLRIRRDAARR